MSNILMDVKEIEGIAIESKTKEVKIINKFSINKLSKKFLNPLKKDSVAVKK